MSTTATANIAHNFARALSRVGFGAAVYISIPACNVIERDVPVYPTLMIPKSLVQQVEIQRKNAADAAILSDFGKGDSVFGPDAEILNTISFDKEYLNVQMHDVKNGRPISQSGVPNYHIYAENTSCERVKFCAKIRNTGDSYFYNTDFDEIWSVSDNKYGAIFTIGSDEGTTGITYIKRVTGGGKQNPLASYGTSNSDGIALERNTAPTYVRYASIKRFSDASIDNKGTIYIMNAELDGGHRTLRSWYHGGEIIIVNSRVTSAPGRVYAWVGVDPKGEGNHGVIKYYNTTWDGQPHPNPAKVSGIFSNMIALGSNPLPAISSFFGDEIQTVTFEYLKMGSTWLSVSNGTFGGGGSALRGDVIFDISLPSGTTHVRASVRMMDNRVLTSAAIPAIGGAKTIDLFDFDAYAI